MDVPICVNGKYYVFRMQPIAMNILVHDEWHSANISVTNIHWQRLNNFTRMCLKITYVYVNVCSAFVFPSFHFCTVIKCNGKVWCHTIISFWFHSVIHQWFRKCFCSMLMVFLSISLFVYLKINNGVDNKIR